MNRMVAGNFPYFICCEICQECNCNLLLLLTEQSGVGVTLQSCTLKVPVSNLCHNTD
jgi:hypothetical protein